MMFNSKYDICLLGLVLAGLAKFKYCPCAVPSYPDNEYRRSLLDGTPHY